MKNYISNTQLLEQPYQNVSHLNTIWKALWDYRETCIPETENGEYDEDWNELTYSMAKLTEQLELPNYD